MSDKGRSVYVPTVTERIIDDTAKALKLKKYQVIERALELLLAQPTVKARIAEHAQAQGG